MDLRKASPRTVVQILDALPEVTQTFTDEALRRAVEARDLPGVVARLEVLRKTKSNDDLNGVLAPIAFDYIERCISR